MNKTEVEENGTKKDSFQYLKILLCFSGTISDENEKVTI